MRAKIYSATADSETGEALLLLGATTERIPDMGSIPVLVVEEFTLLHLGLLGAGLGHELIITVHADHLCVQVYDGYVE